MRVLVTGHNGYIGTMMVPMLAADGARREGLVPIGLASFGRLTRAVRKDEPVPTDAITFEEENVVLDLRRRQDAYFAGQRSR